MGIRHTRKSCFFKLVHNYNDCWIYGEYISLLESGQKRPALCFPHKKRNTFPYISIHSHNIHDSPFLFQRFGRMFMLPGFFSHSSRGSTVGLMVVITIPLWR